MLDIINHQIAVTDKHIADFQTDGVVCLKGLLNTQQLQLLEQGINQNLAKPSPRGKVASEDNDPGKFFEDFCNWQDNPYYPAHALASRPALL